MRRFILLISIETGEIEIVFAGGLTKKLLLREDKWASCSNLLTFQRLSRRRT